MIHILKRKVKSYNYKVVDGTELQRFEASINGYISNGWEILGGVSTSVVRVSNRTNNEDRTLYTQALRKEYGT